jgi:hypothetical protein
MLPFPPVIAWTIGAIGAVLMSKLLAREWRRINAELDAHELDAHELNAREPAAEPVRTLVRGTLRRDPVTGVYRPE